jgi:hypothetical protein
MPPGDWTLTMPVGLRIITNRLGDRLLSVMRGIRSIESVLQCAMLYTVLVLLLSACAGGGQKLTLDTRHVPAVQYLPAEVMALLDDLGYEVIAENDAEPLALSFDNADAQVMAQSYDDYKKKFKARDDPNIRIEVHFRLNEKLTRMRLYNIAEETSSDATMQRYNILKQRLQDEFGTDSVE